MRPPLTPLPEAEALTPLPPALRGPPPRPLPPWATRSRALDVVAGATVGLGLLGAALAIPAPLLAAVPAGLAAWGLGAAWLRRRACEVLREGQPVVARVHHLEPDSRNLTLVYELPTPEGPVYGRFGHVSSQVVQDFGLWPQAGDSAFVLVHPREPGRREVWGFAPPPGQAPRQPPLATRPLPLLVGLAVILGALAVVGGVAAWLLAGR